MLNRKNIIFMLISIEIMLLAITLLILVSSFSFDDILGQTYAMLHSDVFALNLGVVTKIVYLALIILPLLGSIVSGFFGRKVGVSRAQLLYTFIYIFAYVIYKNLISNEFRYNNANLIFLLDVAIIVGAITKIAQITIKSGNKTPGLMYTVLLVNTGVVFTLTSSPLEYCSTAILLCI